MSFNIGTSTSVAATEEPKMDMALDDIIKSRRTENKPRRTPRKNAGKKGPTTATRATGQNAARRNAKVAARRGIARGEGRPNAMEVDRQVNRQQRWGVGKGTTNSQNQQ
eukprot:CAMPEP_0172553224 /NCGR_PEP_ID=MMETSP1067-20121228/49508_1 /TAXON_ID=265564 ORGANISM="Thalassiosira punctigera, Strain Tpunct2005C2" /NCGR_SAMPLE_ID=MMETSP1067 /ASSEMBLY_ACC=CAM_ASM_000444 /LENGTH=108 /DNA_ID=CAMNT_0013341371 /DNA_START=111 /DNA_END=434 /DNA_ORIENTATION=-